MCNSTGSCPPPPPQGFLVPQFGCCKGTVNKISDFSSSSNKQLLSKKELPILMATPTGAIQNPGIYNIRIKKFNPITIEEKMTLCH